MKSPAEKGVFLLSKKRLFDTRYWSDTWVVDNLNPLDSFLFMYLMLNERTNLCGVYEIPLRTIANETGIDKNEVQRMLDRLAPKVYYKDGWVVLVNTVKHQNFTNSKIKAGILKELQAAKPELVNLLNLPDEISMSYARLTMSHDESSMSHDEPSTYNIIKSNLIKSNKANKDTNVSSMPAKTPAMGDEAGTSEVAKVSTKQIDELFDIWEQKVGFRVTNQVKSNRQYASKLLKEHTHEEVIKMIDGVAMSHTDQFAPRINNFAQLSRKWDDLIGWGRRSHTVQMNKRPKVHKI